MAEIKACKISNPSCADIHLYVWFFSTLLWLHLPIQLPVRCMKRGGWDWDVKESHLLLWCFFCCSFDVHHLVYTSSTTLRTLQKLIYTPTHVKPLTEVSLHILEHLPPLGNCAMLNNMWHMAYHWIRFDPQVAKTWVEMETPISGPDHCGRRQQVPGGPEPGHPW